MQKMLRSLALGLAACLALGLSGCNSAASQQLHTAQTFAMDTLVNQRAYGPRAQAAMQRVNVALAEWEGRLSLFNPDGDIGRLNAAAGVAPVEIKPETADLLRQALALSAQSGEAFAITVAPLTLAWGITSSAPRVPTQAELDALLPLVDDAALEVEGNTAFLPRAGMAVDLGGIAKGAACALVRQIYSEEGVASALLSIGGNVYAHGTKPNGAPFRVGFRNPDAQEEASIASFYLTDAVVAVSGGYERFFTQGGQTYIHLFNPATGRPAQSDISSVGVIHPDGAEADFWSTTLYVQGVEKALEYMEAGGQAILLDRDNTLYVSQSLAEGFELYDTEGLYNLVFVAPKGVAA